MKGVLRKIARKIIFTLPQSIANIIPKQVRAGLGVPLGRWEYQIYFWDNWFKDEGGNLHHYYATITRSERRREAFPQFLEPFLANLTQRFPGESNEILDVGSGPISPLTWGHEAGLFRLTCCDALGAEYHQLFEKHGVSQPLPILPIYGEDIDYIEDYHIAFSKNALDHCLLPVTVFENMVRSVKRGGYIIIWSYVDEGSAMSWSGGHQYNLNLEENQLTLTSKDGTKRILTESLPLSYIWSERWDGLHNGQFQVVYERL